MCVHITSRSPVVGAERARLNFDGINCKERNGKEKVGVSSPVHTLDSSVWLCVNRTTETWVYGVLRSYMVSK